MGCATRVLQHWTVNERYGSHTPLPVCVLASSTTWVQHYNGVIYRKSVQHLLIARVAHCSTSQSLHPNTTQPTLLILQSFPSSGVRQVSELAATQWHSGSHSSPLRLYGRDGKMVVDRLSTRQKRIETRKYDGVHTVEFSAEKLQIFGLRIASKTW